MVADERSATMGIADLAERAGVTPRTIRYYVSEGLLPPPGGSGQRRHYTEDHLDRLAEIQRLKAAYLPLHEIRRRLEGSNRSMLDDGPSATSRQTVAAVRPPVAVGTVAAPTVVSAVATQRPIGFGGTPQLGRVEIYEPIESVWRHHTLAPGIELHYRETPDPTLAAAIQRLIREAAAILDGSTEDAPQK